MFLWEQSSAEDQLLEIGAHHNLHMTSPLFLSPRCRRFCISMGEPQPVKSIDEHVHQKCVDNSAT